VTFKPLQLAIAVLFLLLLLLSGCEAFASGDYARAARIWQQEALQADAARAGSYRVRAADAWLLGNQPEQAKDLLKWISRDDLDTWDRARLDLVLADLALRQERPGEAEMLLRNAEPFLPRTSRGRYDISRAAALSGSMMSYEPQAALDLVESLENVSSGELAVRADNPRAERRLTGWLDLNLVIRQNLVAPENVAQSMADWKARHPYHILSETEALDLWLRYRQQFTPPRNIAVLLPANRGV